MFLNTLGKNEMYHSVAEIMGTDIEHIKEYVKENADDIVGCGYNEYCIENMLLIKLIEKCGTHPQVIDRLIVHHITPRECEETIWDEGLLTLSHALTKKTALSDYLKELGFEFVFDGKQIFIYRHGNKVDTAGNHGMTNINMRLGGAGTLNDYNVNGYLFVDAFEIETVKGWLGSPEFLKSLSIFYNDYNIADGYADNCSNYYVSFEVPLNKIDIEWFDASIDEERKTDILLKYTINALAYSEMRIRPFLPMYNPIIFLKRDYDVSKECIRKIWRFKREGSKLVPTDES